MGLMKLIIGEKTPDADDPRYKAQGKMMEEAGANFARITRLDKFAARVQQYANTNRSTFLTIVFVIIGLITFINVYNIYKITHNRSTPQSAVEIQEESLKGRIRK